MFRYAGRVAEKENTTLFVFCNIEQIRLLLLLDECENKMSPT